jgi:hypothetical protein
MAFRRFLACLGVVALIGVAVPSFAQDKPQDKSQDKPQEKKKLSKDETTQYEALHNLVDAVSASKQPAPADIKLTMHPFFLKSGQDIYIPFTLEIQSGFAQYPLAMYVRAVAKSPQAPAAAAKGKPAGNNAFAFEDIAFYNDKSDQVNRALQLPPGDYDLYVAMSERASKDKKAPPPKSTMLVQTLSVPNLLSGLSTSTVIMAKSLEQSNVQLNGLQQLEQPYTISGFKITPSFTPQVSKTGELLWVFYIYNEGTAANGKPDLKVEYNFFRANEDKPFVNMPPSVYNATNLPAEFNLAAGHTVFVGQGVPLTTFNPGDYKLEMKITDNTSNQAITRALNFTVTP